jgi:hypothetical protein
MTIEQLQLKPAHNFINNDVIIKVELLLDAINDWPKPVNPLDDFLIKLQKDSECADVTYEIIDKKSSTLNPATEAWKMESYGVLKKLSDLFEYKSLNEILSCWQKNALTAEFQKTC